MKLARTKIAAAGKIVLTLIATTVILLAVTGHDSKLNAKPEVKDSFIVPGSFSGLAENASPAVVNIRTERTEKGGGQAYRHFFGSPFGKDDPFNDFFEKFFGDIPQQEYKQKSLGSGFIVDRDGYIVTNNHVVENADMIKVRLKSEEEFDAEIVGRDPNTDLALLKIKSNKDLPSIKIGNSDKLKVGEWVVAIGSPFGLEHTVTAGIVSAKERVIGSGPYDDFIQTDAAINPGNSGGPLLNMQGEVIGINTAIYSRSGGYQGIGFAIPINLAKGIIEQLKDAGEVTRGWLGVAIQDVKDDLAEYYGIKGQKGVLVTEVFKGDPADIAGIKAKDIIIAVNGKTVETSRELSSTIAGIGVGEKAKIKVVRDGKTKTFNVKIAKRDDGKIASKQPDKEHEDELGIRVTKLTTDIARKFNITDTDGVIVVSVEPDSKGALAGIMRGDIIKEINHKKIVSVKDYETVIKSIKTGKTIQLFIKRINTGFIVIKLIK